MTEIFETRQADGPHRPRADILAVMIDSLSAHCEVRAVAINGQTGKVTVELYHEGMRIEHEFDVPACATQAGY